MKVYYVCSSDVLIITAVFVSIMVITVSPVNSTVSMPCDTETRVCESCTCYYQSEHETTTGGSFFHLPFNEFPDEWISYSNVEGSSGWTTIPRSFALNAKINNNWFISPPIGTDAIDLQEVHCFFFAQASSSSYIGFYVLEENEDTSIFFSDDYVLTTTGPVRAHKRRNCRSEVCKRRSTKVSIDDLVNAFYLNATLVDTYSYGVYSAVLDNYIGKKIRIAFQYQGPNAYLSGLSCHYQRSMNVSKPTTDDFEGSTTCCGGNSDIDVFIPGHTWGGYINNCLGEVSALDIYISDVDKSSMSVVVQTSILPTDIATDCVGTWNNTLTFDTSTNVWVFGQGIPLNGSSTCSDGISYGNGTLCLGGERPSLCGKKPDVCTMTFSLRRSEKPQEQFVYILKEDEVNITAMSGTMTNRWASSVAIGKSTIPHYYAIDDFGRVHGAGYFKALSSEENRSIPFPRSFILSKMLGKDVVKAFASFSTSIFLTRDKAVYSHGTDTNRIGQGIVEKGQTLPTRHVKFVPLVREIWNGDFDTMFTTEGFELYGFGSNGNGLLGFRSNFGIVYPTYLSTINKMIKDNIIVAPILEITIGWTVMTIVDSTNNLFVTGGNNAGQLGLGNIDQVLTPTLQDKMPAPVRSCACGYFCVQCVTLDNNIIGFGNGVVFASTLPTFLDPFDDLIVRSTKVTRLFNVIILQNGQVFMWGIRSDVSVISELELIHESDEMPFAVALSGYNTAILLKDNPIGVKIERSTTSALESANGVEVPLHRDTNMGINFDLTVKIFARLSKDVEKSERRDTKPSNITFNLVTNTINWPAGDNSTKIILIELVDDSVYIYEKHIEIFISREEVVSSMFLTVVVHDDGDAGKLCFARSFTNVKEDAGSLSVEITRYGGRSSDVYATITSSSDEGGAVNQVDIIYGDGDYSLHTSRILWRDEDELNKILSLSLINDYIFELPKILTLRMEAFGGATIDPGCGEMVVQIEDDMDGGEINFHVGNITDGHISIEITRTNGDSGETELRLIALRRPPESLSSGITLAEHGKDFSFNTTSIKFSDRDGETKFVMITLLGDQEIRGVKVLYLQLEKINGTGKLANGLDQMKLKVNIGSLIEGLSGSVITGAVFGVLGASGVIGGILLYRTRESQKECLRNQWLIQYEQLEEIQCSDGRRSFTGVYNETVVFIESLDPGICNLSEEMFMKYVVLHHPNLAIFFGVTLAPALLVTEYCSKGGVDEALEDGKIPFNTKFKASLCFDASQGIAFMHANNIPHGSLDLAKLVINSRFVCKISGFALQSWQMRYPPLDVICWLAPEQLDVIGAQTYSNSRIMLEPLSPELNVYRKLEISDIEYPLLCDIYSLGMIIFAIFTENRNPYSGDVHMDEDNHFGREALRIRITLEHVRPEMPLDLTDPLNGKRFPDSKEIKMAEIKVMDQVKGCWESDPIKRPTIQKLVKLFKGMIPSYGNLADTMLKSYYEHMENLVSVRTKDLRKEQKKSEIVISKVFSLFRNTLPRHISDELQHGENIIANTYDSVTLLFCEIINFNDISNEIEAIDVISLLDKMYTRFSILTHTYKVEPVKTIGDTYMAISGRSSQNDNDVQRMLLFALSVINETFEWPSGNPCYVRIGIDRGPLSEGIIGSQRISYDIWGSTLVRAQSIARVYEESKVCISQSVYEVVYDDFEFVDGPEGIKVAVPLSPSLIAEIAEKFVEETHTVPNIRRLNVEDHFHAANCVLNIANIRTPVPGTPVSDAQSRCFSFASSRDLLVPQSRMNALFSPEIRSISNASSIGSMAIPAFCIEKY